MARARGLFCLVSPVRGEPSDRRRRSSSAACICCVGPHHKPSSGAPDADLSVRLPLISCCSGGDVRGRSSGAARTPRTPRTPYTLTARRLCGVRSRTPSRGQVCCFPVASAGPGPAGVARTPRTPATQQRACCVRVPAQQGPGSAKLGRRCRWFRSARQAGAQTTPRFRGASRDTAHAGNSNNKSLAEAEAAAAPAEEETCSNDEYALLCREGFSREDVAVVTIQAYFRGHLARRAFRALKSLVRRIQAVARGAFVRRQAEVAIHCMQAMARLQARVRARRMLAVAKPEPQEEQLLHS
ncbi:unnamed protein product [Miscanthus lutarioriparius]|uniref:Uncharacterized protein n=1 Tax=Miscanthus lutarioriparius TaxID=422564 RepID=A0A811MR04_9POAL|nr:unnamed protein product [Miscanthus lutarioriparius]